jgi:hypothetical protein
MGAPRYVCDTEGAVALVAATAKSVVGAKAHANSGLILWGFAVSFDGVTASDVPVTVELLYATWATNGPGTNSTSTTPRQVNGRALTAGFTSGKTWTSEPTVLTVAHPVLSLTPNGGVIEKMFDWGDELDCNFAEGFVLRCTAPTNAVNVRAGLIVSRC